jgi:hypothetical protein
MNSNPETSQRPTPWRDTYLTCDTYFTREKAAKYLHVNPNTLWNHRKEILSHKIGGRYLYAKKELDKLVRPCPRGGNFADIFPWGLGDDRTYLTRREAAKHLGRSVRRTPQRNSFPQSRQALPLRKKRAGQIGSPMPPWWQCRGYPSVEMEK